MFLVAGTEVVFSTVNICANTIKTGLSGWKITPHFLKLAEDWFHCLFEVVDFLF